MPAPRPDTNPFETILTTAAKKGIIPGRTKEAREWFRRAARRFNEAWRGRIVTKEQLMADTAALTNNLELGKMYMFYYDPKWKDELPYYDKFPLIFPFDKKSDRFLGINLHYLQPLYRAKLMDALYTITNNRRYDSSTKLKLTYGVLKNASKFRWFKPCVKEYLNDHVRSSFLRIHPVEWDIAAFLPVSQFEKADKRKVWADSAAIINKS